MLIENWPHVVFIAAALLNDRARHRRVLQHADLDAARCNRSRGPAGADAMNPI
jgi:hypothetical protein